jgi:hypothetical protein
MGKPQLSLSPQPVIKYAVPRVLANSRRVCWSSKKCNFEGTITLVNEQAVFDKHFHRYRKRMEDYSDIFNNLAPVEDILAQPEPAPEVEPRSPEDKAPKPRKKKEAPPLKKGLIRLEVSSHIDAVAKNPQLIAGKDCRVTKLLREGRKLRVTLQCKPGMSITQVLEPLAAKKIEHRVIS